MQAKSGMNAKGAGFKSATQLEHQHHHTKMQPTFYDPNSDNETSAPPLPNAPLVTISSSCSIQPPLTRRGTGPGLIVLLPNPEDIEPSQNKPLDPQPVQKWAEEGYGVAGITPDSSKSVLDQIAAAVAGLKATVSVQGDSFGLIAHRTVTESLDIPNISCIVTFDTAVTTSLPVYAHLSSDAASVEPAANYTSTKYDAKRNFVLPQSASYASGAASLAHTRTLVFLRKHLGGPHFDLEAIWDEHTYWEFERRSVAHTMATMVAQPYVNHVPTMTGGMGRAALTNFYRDHFIFCNPPDTALNPLSRTVGPDRVVDEFIFTCTHTTTIPWLLPNMPPTNAKLSIPMLGVINIRGDRLYHEHIWWDQATALKQIGFLPTHVDHNGSQLRLPVAGAESAQLLQGEPIPNNQMLDPEWVKK